MDIPVKLQHIIYNLKAQIMAFLSTKISHDNKTDAQVFFLSLQFHGQAMDKYEVHLNQACLFTPYRQYFSYLTATLLKIHVSWTVFKQYLTSPLS